MKRSALIIGVDNYQYVNKLAGAINDSEAINDKLSVLGFECKTFPDLSSDEIIDMRGTFSEMLQTSDVGLFYFAGHGVEISNQNFLICSNTTIDENLSNENLIASLKRNSLPMNEVIEILEYSKVPVKIIILDVCRSPIKESSTRGMDRIPTLAPVVAYNGTIICFATSPGQVAKEKNGHGVYTEVLLSLIETPGLSIEKLFKSVREMVSTITNSKQIPWEHTSLIGEFTFYPNYLDDSFVSTYSSKALADRKYSSSTEEVSVMIEKLSSQNWYTQNPAISELESYLLNTPISNLNKDDIFILGRNVYQCACGNAHYAISFIDRIQEEKLVFDDEIMFHLINGMAYEIYFDSYGKLRKNFKTNYYGPILKILNSFQRSLKFIISLLTAYDNTPVYLPGSQDIRIVTVQLTDNSNFYTLDQIYISGKPIVFVDGDNYSEDNEGILSLLKIDNYESLICTQLAAPGEKIEICYLNDGKKFKPEEDKLIQYPIDSYFRYYEN